MIDKLFHIKRVNIIGIGLALIGMSIIFTPVSASLSIINFIYHEYGVNSILFGGLMSIGGWLILFLNTRLLLFVLCTIPWAFYTLAAFFFVWRQGLTITVGLAYLLIYALIFREALERPL